MENHGCHRHENTRCFSQEISMRKIERIYWPNQISNEELYRWTSTLPVCEDTEMEMDRACPAEPGYQKAKEDRAGHEQPGGGV